MEIRILKINKTPQTKFAVFCIKFQLSRWFGLSEMSAVLGVQENFMETYCLYGGIKFLQQRQRNVPFLEVQVRCQSKQE